MTNRSDKTANRTANRVHLADAESSNSLVRRLGYRYLAVLALVALLITLDQALVQPLLLRLNTYAPAINLSGRQRMLSQRLTKTALAFEASDDPSEREARRLELRETLGQWARAHAALQLGDEELGIRRIDSPEIAQQWRLLQPHFEAMCGAASRIVEERDGFPGSDGSRGPVHEILAHESRFLISMERIVKLMERSSAEEIARLRAFDLAIAVVVILLLVGLGWFVVRPATRTIRRQVDDLETRVARRTQELADALHSLRQESRERETAESRNNALAVQLAHVDRVASMSHLSVGLAHEINQPLGAIANHAEACDVILSQLPETRVREQLRSSFASIKGASLRAGQIVRGLRNFLRPGSNAAVVADINELVEEVVALCRREIAEAEVELTLHLAADQGAVCVEPIQIQQVLVNLVQNAIQAMQNCQTGTRHLRIRTSSSREMVRVDLCDSGPGFTAGEAATMFDVFRTTKGSGLGFGLPVCRSIVERYDGAIWVESSPGNGAQVSFTLPFANTNDSVRPVEPDCLCSR